MKSKILRCNKVGFAAIPVAVGSANNGSNIGSSCLNANNGVSNTNTNNGSALTSFVMIAATDRIKVYAISKIGKMKRTACAPLIALSRATCKRFEKQGVSERCCTLGRLVGGHLYASESLPCQKEATCFGEDHRRRVA